jgi:putative oxidoreductase
MIATTPPRSPPLPAGLAAASLAGRVLLAAIFLISGVGKVFDPASTIAYIRSAGLPLPVLAYAAALSFELVGGAFLMIGYRTRSVAGLLAAFAIVTAVVFHGALADPNQLVHFLKNLAIAGGLLQLVVFGRPNTASVP